LEYLHDEQGINSLKAHLEASNSSSLQPIMRPFRNKGWIYYDKMQTIIPMNAPRGSRVFRPAATSSSDTHKDKEGGSSGVVDLVDEDEDIESPLLTPPSSINSSKRKLDALQEGLSANDSQVSLISETSKRSQRSKADTADTKSSRVTPATAIHGMQGSINRLTETLEKSININMEDPREAWRLKALQMLEEVLDLSMEQKIALASLFTDNMSAATTFVMIKDEDFRRQWIADYLAKHT
jgi:hypothetical protein